MAITELALSLVLMVATGILVRSFWDLFKVQPGFNPDRVMAIQTWLPGPNDPKTDRYLTAAQQSGLLREILRRGTPCQEWKKRPSATSPLFQWATATAISMSDKTLTYLPRFDPTGSGQPLFRAQSFYGVNSGGAEGWYRRR